MDASRWLSLFGQQWNFYGPTSLRRRGVPFNPLSLQRTKEFFTNKWHYVIEAPGHRDFIRNIITDALQANTTHSMVPANGNFTTTFFTNKWHYNFIVAPGHRDLIKNMITDALQANTTHIMVPAKGNLTITQKRYDEIQNELIKVGWKKDFIEKNTPVVPISGLLKKSDNMPWWKGMKVFVETTEFHVDTLYDMLDKVGKVPFRPLSVPMRMLITGIYKIKGVGDALAGRVKQIIMKPDEEVAFLPTHMALNSCTGKVFTAETHQRMDQTYLGDIVGLSIKALDKNNIPCSSDDMDMAYKKLPPWARPRSSTRRVPDEEVVLLLTHMAPNPRTGKVFTAEIHHQRVDWTFRGDNEGLNIEGLDKNNMPCSSDDMVYKKVPPWDRPGSLTRRLRLSTSRMRSKWVPL